MSSQGSILPLGTQQNFLFAIFAGMWDKGPRTVKARMQTLRIDKKFDKKFGCDFGRDPVSCMIVESQFKFLGLSA